MRKEERVVNNDFFPSVTFLVPCWNEEKTVGLTVKSILDLDYPKDKIRVIVIDDGSKDDTFNIAKKYENDQVMVLQKENGGKHTALNLGLEYTSTDLVAIIDADSTLDKNALREAAKYFKDQEVKGLASCMQIRDVNTIWQRAQAVEYMLSTFWRKSYSAIDAIQVMPGPFSVFRRSVFDEIGNYRKAHNAEDFEMTLRLHKNHYKIVNAHKAYVYTVGPATLKGLLRQRVRWIHGFLENARDYRFMFFKREYGNFGLFTLPFAITFVFYVLYAITVTLLKTIQLVVERLNYYFSSGLHWPRLSFDVFYISIDILFIQSIFLLTVLAYILMVSRTITDEKRPISFNFFLYFLLYPFVAPVFIFIAVYKFLRKKENKWILQDTKAS
jgi:cellulose synthase/poly-beta-1,6-N-acetylglucosamine synthase-like glycosyltransferase